MCEIAVSTKSYLIFQKNQSLQKYRSPSWVVNKYFIDISQIHATAVLLLTNNFPLATTDSPKNMYVTSRQTGPLFVALLDVHLSAIRHAESDWTTSRLLPVHFHIIWLHHMFINTHK
jgi:hypothetical protein